MHQGRYSSSALLLLFASIIVGFVVPPVVAAQIHLFKSKEEALAYCNNPKSMIEGENSQQANYAYGVVYPDQQGNDVFYNCGDKNEYPTGVNRSKKDCKKASIKYKDTPEPALRYECIWSGRWVLVQCNPGDGRPPCIPLELKDYVQSHPELLRALLKQQAFSSDDVMHKFQEVEDSYSKADKKLHEILRGALSYYHHSKQKLVDGISSFFGTQTN
ncbi:hypothetical protein O0I10_011803 [Lichtheimia ornata]|uniref:Uncharacterized protein n=1 Tax=Lichtheimia ornata TaxID=688661 RepID=A0AAD7UTP9_9FUNG|nr:uncharacterized protein O0I10_011803 [Lichtheimia ornata]KAJ8652544.1 hypothetical protein O0I10_011803 [Lichtheimia ornata]